MGNHNKEVWQALGDVGGIREKFIAGVCRDRRTIQPWVFDRMAGDNVRQVTDAINHADRLGFDVPNLEQFAGFLGWLDHKDTTEALRYEYRHEFGGRDDMRACAYEKTGNPNVCKGCPVKDHALNELWTKYHENDRRQDTE